MNDLDCKKDMEQIELLLNQVLILYKKNLEAYVDKIKHIHLLEDKNTIQKNSNEELQNEIDNLHKVSLLKSLHKKLDTKNNHIRILEIQIEHFKKVIGEQKQRINSLKNTNKQLGEIEKHTEEKTENVDEDENLDNKEDEGEDEDVEDNNELKDEDDEEVDLIKIKNKFYYITENNSRKNFQEVYEAIKDGDGEYDIGDYIGIFKNNVLILK